VAEKSGGKDRSFSGLLKDIVDILGSWDIARFGRRAFRSPLAFCFLIIDAVGVRSWDIAENEDPGSHFLSLHENLSRSRG